MRVLVIMVIALVVTPSCASWTGAPRTATFERIDDVLDPDHGDEWEHDHGESTPMESARAAVGLAAATANLNALVADPTVARSLRRGTSGGVGGPEPVEREVVVGTPRPSRTLVTVERVAGPPIEEEEAVALEAAHRRSSRERFTVPIANPRITSRFGPRIDPITGAAGRMHRGTDFGAPTGTEVLATAAGEVVLGGWCDRGTGNCVVIDHAGGWRSQYFHLSRVNVSPGDRVREGEVIGEVGSTGRSTGPHLHFQIGQVGGAAVDPETLFGQPLE